MLVWQKHQNGMSLIEVLVALVLLGFAAVATLKLQTLQLKTQDEGGERVMASQLGSGMSQRIQANPLALAQYQNQVVDAKKTVRTKPTPDCESVNCTEDQLARFDMWWWDSVLRQSLPSVFACIVPSKLNVSDEVNIVVLWRGRKALIRDEAIIQAEVKTCENLLGNDSRFQNSKRKDNNQDFERMWQQSVILE